MCPYIYDPVNRELRTVPEYFRTSEKEYLGFERAEDITLGSPIAPGKVLGAVHWDDGSVLHVVAPENCTGKVGGFGDLQGVCIDCRPSQVLMILDP